MKLSAETINVCLSLLAQVTLSGADPDLEPKAAQVARVRAELTAALAEPESDQTPERQAG